MTDYDVALMNEACELGRGIEFFELQAASARLPKPPRFFFGNFAAPLSDHYFKMTHVHQIGVFIGLRFVLTGPYLLTQDDLLLICPQANIHPLHVAAHLNDLSDRVQSKAKIIIDGTAAMIFGPGQQIFGHWILDFFPKIYLLERAGYDIARLKFIVPSDAPPFAMELLRLAGIPRESITEFDVDAESVHCERLLLPTTLHNGLRFADLFGEAVAWLRQRIEACFWPLSVGRGPERIFMSRGHAFAANRALANRAEIEAMAVAAGFTLVYPEEMPLLRQFSVFAGARQIIGEYGSALHNAIFSPAGTVICGLRGNGVHPGFAQSGLAEALGHHTGYVIGTNLPDSWDFVVEPGHFAAALRCISGDLPLAP